MFLQLFTLFLFQYIPLKMTEFPYNKYKELFIKRDLLWKEFVGFIRLLIK